MDINFKKDETGKYVEDFDSMTKSELVRYLVYKVRRQINVLNAFLALLENTNNKDESLALLQKMEEVSQQILALEKRVKLQLLKH